MATATNNKGTPANDSPPADGEQSAPNGDGTPPKNTTEGQQTATEAEKNVASNQQGNENDQATRANPGDTTTLKRDPDLYFTHGSQIYGKDMGEGNSVADLDRLVPPTEKTKGLVGEKERVAEKQKTREAQANRTISSDTDE